MRQIMQGLQAGQPTIVTGNPGRLVTGHIQIRTEASLISAGTERMLVEFANAGLLGKARQQPDRVRDVLEKMKTDGVMATVGAVRSKLADPLPLGYSQAGIVTAIGPGVEGFSIGQRVASNGPHAEVVVVPQTLCAHVPKEVAPQEACFATIGSVALEGIRLARPEIGEVFVVTGLGLIGLITVQLLRASGCQVIGVDTNAERLAQAEAFGATCVRADGAVVESAMAMTNGRGVDGVILTLATQSSDPVHQAAEMCRKRGRIVLVGVTGLELQRADFYEKELSFQVSCAYGPGRYDTTYEDDATDYPYGLVRWTAGRNMQAVIDLIARSQLDVASLVTHTFDFDDAVTAYETLKEVPSSLGIVLEYATNVEARHHTNFTVQASHLGFQPLAKTRNSRIGGVRLGIIGSGQFTQGTVLPALLKANAEIAAISGSGGGTTSAARRFNIGRVAAAAADIIDDETIDAVVITTRHDSHAELVATALQAGKDVFVEKPLSIDAEGLDLVIAAYEERVAAGRTPIVGIGFNRRFAPISVAMKEELGGIPVPKAISLVVNAGHVPSDHWTQNPMVGGGRLVGEGCHFIDLARFLTGSAIKQIDCSTMMGSSSADSYAITLEHEDGSIAQISYFANGSKRFPKERVTVFAAGKVLENDNFRKLRSFGKLGSRTRRHLRQDKGHSAGFCVFVDAILGQCEYPIPFGEIIEVSRTSLLAAHVGK